MGKWVKERECVSGGSGGSVSVEMGERVKI